MLALAFVMTVSAGQAHAYINGVDCFGYVSAQICYSGDGYHTNHEVYTALPSSSTYQLCAKAADSGGAVRGGSGCNSSSGTPSTTWRNSCLTSVSPVTYAYGYWADGYAFGRWTTVTNLAGSDNWLC